MNNERGGEIIQKLGPFSLQEKAYPSLEHVAYH